MLQHIIDFSVRNKLIIGLFMLAWIAYGAFEVSRLPIDAVPDITNNQVQIITTAPALGAQDVERLITFPVEQAISNIPGLKQSRSLSRFGLSLITVVFDDTDDVYWARQQVTERLAQVDIPENASKPELAPVTTGLGEIYQYVVKARPGYEKKYSLADLRTIQDWVIRRQLLGTEGVADVSTFGGELKQYEVAVNPSRLKAQNVTISDLFNALHANNQNTGGAYIEKGPTVMYIRSEGLAGSIADIENIVVKNTASGVPVLVRDLADVRYGAATRYGALTYNDEGEVTGGIVMMLKGANSSQIIKNVKDRIAQIRKTLPAGVIIEPFLDRTKMVNNAISTVEKNLFEGALIVVLVLVLFLGNLRAGLIVASVIPLSMLFAIIMMNTFGVSGNLMSLGALDFGLIVDGAVIIVEAILHHIHFSKRYAGISTITQEEMNKEVIGSAARMMNAAVFGQIIILIVYLPILSLQGIEGKMFKPMAQTVAFAILGAFILSITYVPMISSLFISKKIAHTPNFSDRVMMKLEKAYQRWLEKALQFRKSMVVTAVALLAIALVIFARMGGEFIPQLEEGDYAVETRLLVGTNLSTTIQSIEKISALLKKEYPEVEKVVSRIGSAEIPTDPMPIEGGDMIIVMKDKSEWKSAKSFQEMASKMAATVQEAIPGVSLGFQFPVQMRFNELMTGAKQDVVCKVYGEDLDQLARYATQVGEISRTVKGATDIYVEKVVGMPQVVIRYDRGEIARYGLSIDEINRTVNAAFAGAAAGQIYEGEKRFDLVVRVGSEGRKNLEDVRNLLISTPTGTQIPLYQLAAINEIEGPNQIQREDTRRRIIVGFNVRGRDVQSIVEELQQKIGQKVKFSPGYTITYGGAFENLQEAKKRLGVAVPVALLLIFVMLYFAFSSVKEGALIYTAIPLSAIGGVFALALRGMPFSISAGVGFIALFGVAVLNGIVLISEFNRIRDEGKITDIVQLVMEGTRNRLRPVLMTAAVASLGFLPMALSNGAGAEVQRPLATVVIGGLITATILTLFILPALYIMFNRKIRIKPAHIVPVSLLFFLSAQTTEAQETQKPLTMEQAVEMALKNNRQLQGARLNEAAVKKLQRTAFDVPKTQLSADYGQMNSINNDTRFGISQSISFPTVYTHQKKALRENYGVAQAQTQLSERDLRAAVRGAFTGLLWMEEKKKLLRYADSVYRLFERKSNLRFKTGETNILEKTTAETRRRQISIQLDMLSSDIDTALYTFNLLLQDSSLFRPQGDSLRMVFDADLPDTEKSRVKTAPQLELAQHQAEAARWRWKTEKARLLPELMLGYNNQSIAGSQIVNGQETFFGSGKRFTYVNAGIGIPLFFGAQSARISAARLEWQQQERQQEQVQRTLETQRRNILQEIRKYRSGLDYYDNDGLRSADQIIRTADQQFTGGEIDYLQWVILVDQAISIRNARLDMLNNYNQAVIRARKLYNL